MDVITYFKHMENVVCGTRSVREEYDNQFGRWTDKLPRTLSPGTTCTHCGVGIPGDIIKHLKKMECPCCHKTFSVTISTVKRKSRWQPKEN